MADPTYEWHRIFNLTEFAAEELVSRTLNLDLDGRGPTTFEIFRANYTSVLYDGTFLPVQFGDANPFVIDTYAVYRDEADWVWFGFEIEEDE